MAIYRHREILIIHIRIRTHLEIMNHSAKEISGREIPSKMERGLDLQMQSDLVRRAKEAGVKPEDWVGKYAEIYREIITKDPSLLESYRENGEEALKSVEKLLEEKK